MAGFELISDEGYRFDGRKPSELRRVRCNMGVFTQADGSAYIEQGNTKVLAAIYGPHEASNNMRSRVCLDKCFINCEFSQAMFSSAERKKRSRGDRKGKDMSAHIKQTFEAAVRTQLYPRSQIDIYLQVLHSDGSLYCACVNAATLALIDAGIAMKDYVCACSASLTKETSLIDINHVEELAGCAEFSAAIMPKLDQIIYSELNGRIHQDELGQLVDAVTNGCKDIFAVIDRFVRSRLEETASYFTHS
uniref:exosome complex component RRP41-like n=1 Tax=Ciona intestinalis TaxID=7719 RepID=UPI00006A4B1C|nr:exosome complex component RRP41-like [Ciona intestinalis]|eukprot:XP_002131069.1 exosome complex component RRP41-like [Ciona intestinalis]